ncbi:1-phosphofructokinase [Marininema halotolerans]|uniref:Tagatose-6-phosphate kinase n=1 Tax=Marininema halotolerans TaxID=1155944 RepID=A0A1I6SJK1_9BACL|nr:1-phosphofructokinase [Marininema halotolerans]SFS77127.1 1-phosphofructokinase [Marininema halotolerans]
MSKILTVTLNPAMDKTLVLPQFHEGEVNRVQKVMTTPAGKGINVARALTKWGEDVQASGWMGNSWQGDAFLSQLSEWKIPQQFLKVSGDVRTNTKLINSGSDVVTDINEPGFTVQVDDVNRLLVQWDKWLEECDQVVLSGSLPMGAPSDLYRRMIKLAKNRGKIVVLDADGLAFQEGIKALPYLIKPNREELQAFLHRELHTDLDYIEAGRELLTRGIEAVVISMGAEGAWFFQGKEIFHVSPPPVQAMNPVGAGDGMVAGIIKGIFRGWSFEKTACFATAAGAQAATIAGTGYGEEDVIQALIAGVQVRKI